MSALHSYSDPFDAMGQFTDTVAGDVRNPYPMLAQKRRRAPVEIAPNMRFDGVDGDALFAYTFNEVQAILRDNRTFSSSAIRDLMAVVMGPYVLVGMDEPEHRRHRNLVSLAFRHKTLAAASDELIEPIVDELIGQFAPDGRAELVRQFTYLFPVQVIAELLGVPHQDHEQFNHLAHDVINVAMNPERGLLASAQLRDYLSTVVEARRRKPKDDLISELVEAELDGERLGDEEIYSFLRLLLPAGAETTYRATGSFIYALLTHPDQLEAVRDEPELMTQAVEESIRWETPLLITSRIAVRECEVAGVEVPAGSEVVVHVGSANHDETRWDDPDHYDLFRPQLPHIAFGSGPHMCLGMHLARLEMAGAVARLLERLPGLRPDPDRWEADDAHIHGERFRSPTCLPVTF